MTRDGIGPTPAASGPDPVGRDEPTASPAVLALSDVELRRDRRELLRGIDWRVEQGQHWILLGANGSGKTSLVRIASLVEHPSQGGVEVLGERLGATDVRALRRRVALVSPALVDLVRPGLDPVEIVMCGRHAALEPWWHHYDDADRERASSLLVRNGVGNCAGRAFSTLSSGERQRVLLARAFMADPGLVLLDEPTAGLDLAGREELVERLDRIVSEEGPPMVLVTHHVEEIPASFTHLLALRRGAVLAAGPIEDVFDEALLGECFGLDLALARHTDGRWSARRRS